MPTKSIYLCLLLSVIATTFCNAQEKQTHPVSIGFVYGFGTQQSYPFNSKDYSYKPQSYKAEINISIKRTRKWRFETLIEPGVYISKHQLLNKYYVKPSDSDNYLELRDIYTKQKTINEFSLGIGFIARYQLLKPLSTFALVSIGPTISDTSTERLDKGFAFTDVFALGFSFHTKALIFDTRVGVRHVSNADLKEKNSGHNNSFLEFGFRIPL